MADLKITELTELTAPTIADLVGVVDDVVGTPITKKVTLDNMIGSGWNRDSDVWVYVSASSFKIEGKDVTAKFAKGTKVSYDDGSVDYGVVASSAFSTDTTVTLIANADYAIADETLTAPRYSYVESPQGFPSGFNFTLVPSGSLTLGNATVTARFSLKGTRMFLDVYVIVGSSTTVGDMRITLPADANLTAIKAAAAATGTLSMDDDNGGKSIGIVRFETTSVLRGLALNASGTYLAIAGIAAAVPFTWATADSFMIRCAYEIA